MSNFQKKYELTDESIQSQDREIKRTITLYHIRAIRDFADVKAGDLGGFIEKESNLSHDDNCWVYDKARVFQNARVFENAKIFNNAIIMGLVYGNAKVTGYHTIRGLVHGNARLKRNGHSYVKQNVYYAYGILRIVKFMKMIPL
ncbi:hypothetical protein [Bartonella rattaustraliani]|uniref:hypothetical protein n=1 Tax=Bartonella rattaustraliani TaxID=481139 RepID=UPI0002E855C9|nr:hypothetical protein [Bartonella rattaustraliani]